LKGGQFTRRTRDTASIAIHRSIDPRQGAGGQVGLAATGAVADDTNLAVEVGQGAEVADGRGHVAHGAIVRHAALGPHTVAVLLGRDLAFAEMQVRTDGHIAVMGEFASDLLGRLIPAGHVMDH
jgi:hypothetical protein